MIRYTPLRPFLLRLNDSAATCAGLKPPKRRGRRSRQTASDAEVGGGAGAAGPAAADGAAIRGGDAPVDRIGSKA